MSASSAYLAPVLTPAQIRALLEAVDVAAEPMAQRAVDPDSPGHVRRWRHLQVRSLVAAQDVLQRTLQAEGKGDA